MRKILRIERKTKEKRKREEREKGGEVRDEGRNAVGRVKMSWLI